MRGREYEWEKYMPHGNILSPWNSKYIILGQPPRIYNCCVAGVYDMYVVAYSTYAFRAEGWITY